MTVDNVLQVTEIEPSTVRLLVVSSDPETSKMLSEALGRHGFRVNAVTSGDAALEAMDSKSNRPDCVIVDEDLSGMAGIETCARLSMSGRGPSGGGYTPVILLSSLQDTGALVVGLDAGCAEFLSKPVNPLELFARVQSVLRIKRMSEDLESAESVLHALARSVEAKDGTTGDHCDRLAKNAVVFGREIGCERSELRALKRGGYLHDIGKIAIPDAVLNKPGKLNDEEWTVMRSHVIVGEEMCRGLSTMRDVLPIIRHHHERFNGSGYPDRLAGERIPRLARVFLLVDVYDALTAPRPYKAPFAPKKALDIMREELGKGYSDPEFSRVFFRLAETHRLQVASANSTH